MVRLLATGHIREYEDSVVVGIELARVEILDSLAQLSCLRYAITDRLNVKVANQYLELRRNDSLAAADRARIGVTKRGLILELSVTELEVWLSFLSSCYWNKVAPVDHIDLSVPGPASKEYVITIAVATQVDLKSADEVRRMLGLSPRSSHKE